ncbi:MAG: YceI family protein [Gammaproteobacteria bacterium]|nr:YceI family protein [Gammaproteobacteria bacterium]
MTLKPLVYTLFLLGISPLLSASEYLIDTKGAHAFIQFRISHLGYSWLLGRFNTFAGRFSYDDKEPSAAHIELSIETQSIDTNHAERDKHLRGKEFLDTKRFPKAHFVSTGYRESPDGTGTLHGHLTLRGVTRPISIDVRQIGAGMDPWGGYRRGFEGTSSLRLKDYGIDYNLGPAAETVQLALYVEGIREKRQSNRKKR